VPERARAAAVALLVGAAVVLSGCAIGDGTTAASSGGHGTSWCTAPAHAESQSTVTPIVKRAKPELPTTVTDFTGEPVTVASANRVLALDTYGTLASTVYALGLGDRLVGRDVSTGIPALRHLPLVTHNGHELNAEAILDLNPSVILTDYSIGPLEVQLQLKDAGIPVVILDDSRSRDTVGAQIREVARVLGVTGQGEALASRTERQIVAAEAKVEALATARSSHRIRMVFLYMRGAASVYYWFGEGSGADDLIDALGGVDVAKEVGLEGTRPITSEGLVKAEPELFLMMTDGLRSVGGVDGLLEVPGVAETTAGINRCVVDMSDYQILSFGPQFPATLRALGEAVYGRAGSPD
jgi:iron complex transport system substrate-binding protein